jgi:hypothetical protein
VLRNVTRGQKRVEDARRRAYDPRVHHLRKTFLRRAMDGRVKPGHDGLESTAVTTSRPANWHVTRGLDPRVHLLRKTFLQRRWMAGSSPAMTA